MKFDGTLLAKACAIWRSEGADGLTARVLRRLRSPPIAASRSSAHGSSISSDGGNIHGRCPVCDSYLYAHLRKVPTKRTERMLDLFACLECQSLGNPSGYREGDAELAADVEWHKKVYERNRAFATKLLNELEKIHGSLTSIIEIGCGTGTFIEVAGERDIKAVGYDLNHHAIDHGVGRGLDLHAEEWTARLVSGTVDALLCLSVLEHIQEPRPLLAELARGARKSGAGLFVSVPVVDRDRWHYLLDPSIDRPGTPFFDNDVHVTHFSTLGLIMALEEFGARSTTLVRTAGWDGVWATF